MQIGRRVVAVKTADCGREARSEKVRLAKKEKEYNEELRKTWGGKLAVPTASRGAEDAATGDAAPAERSRSESSGDIGVGRAKAQGASSGMFGWARSLVGL